MSSQSGDDSQESQECVSEEQAPITTLMIRNIPCKITLQALMNVIDYNGFAGSYNFLHLPGRGTPFSNLGYAFINFYHSVMADFFVETFQGVAFSTITGLDSEKVIQIRPAHAQGFSENMAKVRDMLPNQDKLFAIEHFSF
mmetsp:Transcript_78715/g.137531  ORF Transcript_78715/g.137531 Transcript_78715/m.137531 type:complete len:141 (+) Transcript_78715:26-448(+)